MAEDDAQRYHCSYCGCDITLRLKCNVCHDFDLCLQCFASGALTPQHMPDHPYQLIDEGSFPLLTDDWGAIEEVLLLDAVEQDGFGNWEDIGAHVFTKTARGQSSMSLIKNVPVQTTDYVIIIGYININHNVTGKHVVMMYLAKP
jgi:hypothetical protein